MPCFDPSSYIEYLTEEVELSFPELGAHLTQRSQDGWQEITYEQVEDPVTGEKVYRVEGCRQVWEIPTKRSHKKAS